MIDEELRRYLERLVEDYRAAYEAGDVSLAQSILNNIQTVITGEVSRMTLSDDMQELLSRRSATSRESSRRDGGDLESRNRNLERRNQELSAIIDEFESISDQMSVLMSELVEENVQLKNRIEELTEDLSDFDG